MPTCQRANVPTCQRANLLTCERVVVVMSYRVTLLPGDGIGPEVTAAMKEVVAASGVDIQWDEIDVGLLAMEKGKPALPEEALKSLRRNKVGLKGPVTTPVGRGHVSVNVMLRKQLNLYANVRPIKSFRGVGARYENVDLVVVRENTEDVYAGVEHEVTPGVVECVKIITWEGSTRVAKYAFDYARRMGRQKITAVHKANIMKLSDGLFLKACQKVAKRYPDIQYEEAIVDAACMKLVMNPQAFDVLLCENLYGDIISDLCGGFIGGIGLAAGANIGEKGALFETVHGSAPDIAGKGIANPTAMILAAAMMLDYLGEHAAARRIRTALEQVIAQKRHVTPDIGGKATTMEMGTAVAQRVKE
ncbi:MAG: isocitrate dehydrogenase (NAD(+)) [Abditibacteriales bacterium]|nr:isocitrate dehydrogenase (NAD(+)) [Abditibacteriales bacterium]